VHLCPPSLSDIHLSLAGPLSQPPQQFHPLSSLLAPHLATNELKQCNKKDVATKPESEGIQAGEVQERSGEGGPTIRPQVISAVFEEREGGREREEGEERRRESHGDQ
jgi:hypothetical protein